MRLPPLNALRAFEAAARHRGFTGAAAELFVTRGAISRHVKLLEEHLGVQLFVREAHGVRLTPAGRRFHPTLTEAFEKIARESQRVAEDRGVLRIICPPGTSIRWLIPRLPEFTAAHPDIEVRLTTDFYGGAGFDPVRFDIGFSVEHWGGRAPDLVVEPLLASELTPACTPRYLESIGPFRSPNDLSVATLLHETPARADWTAWLTAFEVADVDPASGLEFPNLDMSIKAAVVGAGVAIADLVLCRDELEAGVLVAPFPDMICASPRGRVSLIGTRSQWHRPTIAAFRNWARDAANQT